MENINDVKNRIKNKSNKSIKKNEKEIKPNKFKFFAFKFFVVLLVFCFASLACTKDVKLKNIIYNKVYNTNFSFSYFKNIYNKYVGNIIPFQNIFEDKKYLMKNLNINLFLNTIKVSN